MLKFEVIVIGAGAAGLMAAIEAGKRGRSVLVIDRAGKTGSKIRISGGGRCNFTNTNVSSENYLSDNPHFCKSALSRYIPQDFIELLQRYKLHFEEKENGRLFLSSNAAAIVRMLEEECKKHCVRVQPDCAISGLKKEESGYILTTTRGIFGAGSLIVASGGLSYPGLGASGFGHSIAKKFGLRVTPLRPGLVPFVFSPREVARFRELSGISLRVGAECRGRQFVDQMLFTHNGLSGPAMLQVSLYWLKGDAIVIDLLPGLDAGAFLEGRRASRIELRNLLSTLFPDRFSRTWCELHGGSKPLNRYSQKELEEIAGRLHKWELIPAGTEGFGKAEVTVGGVDTSELSSKTMEAKKVPGLFFAGEVIDVTGQLGGYNLHWAWASGYAAGQYA